MSTDRETAERLGHLIRTCPEHLLAGAIDGIRQALEAARRPSPAASACPEDVRAAAVAHLRSMMATTSKEHDAFDRGWNGALTAAVTTLPQVLGGAAVPAAGMVRVTGKVTRSGDGLFIDAPLTDALNRALPDAVEGDELTIVAYRPESAGGACTCTHAPEQHGADGCLVVALFRDPCPCRWNGKVFRG